MSDLIGAFVRAVAAGMPSLESLVEQGLSEDEARAQQAPWRIVHRAPLPKSAGRHLFDDLVARYDCDHVELPGSISLRAASFDPRFVSTQIATWGGDPIVVRASEEVVRIDRDSPTRVVSRCAETPAAFLRALTHMQRGCSDVARWRGRAAVLVDECARLAGGEVYRGAYEAMIPPTLVE